jgi:hypothetical protein
MSGLRTVLDLAARGVLVFPCQWEGAWRKCPLTEHGFQDASGDPGVIEAWWRRWPKALIGVPTGILSGFVVLDIDVKHADRNGFDTLAAFALAILPHTPLVHTPSGGLHLYFDPAGQRIPTTQGSRGRGIGPGLDWRAEGGYVIAPSPGSGYDWDPICNLDRVSLAKVPAQLLPAEPEKVRFIVRPIRPTIGLSPYAEAALDNAARRIIAVANGEQEATINGECFAIGTLAGAGGVPADFARRVLVWAARQVPSADPRRPWRPGELEDKANRAFDDGMRRPRELRRA